MVIDSQKRLIVVLGMHRSGTSAVTRGLKVLGVELGDNLMAAIPGNNDKGFWEDLDLYALNVEILASLGFDWDSVVTPTEDVLLADDMLPFRERAIVLLGEKIRDNQFYGVKDPRFSTLLPFWKKVFEHLELQVSYVVSIRNPMCVARSLWLRDHIKPEKSYYLWMQHIITCMLASEGCARVLIDYDLLIERPGAQLIRLAERLGFNSGSISATELTDYINNYLDSGLRHNNYTLNDLQSDPAAPDKAISAYLLLLKIASDELDERSPVVNNMFTQMERHMKEILPALQYIKVIDEDILQLKNILIGNDEQLDEAVSRRKSRTADLDELVNVRDELVADLKATIAEQNEVVVDLKTKVAEQNEVVVDLKALVAMRDGQVVGLNEAVGARDWKITELKETISERNWRINEYKEMISTRDWNITELKGTVSARDEQIAVINQQLHTVTTEYHNILASKSMLITRPFRSLRRNLLTRPYRFIRCRLADVTRGLWRRLPLSENSRQKLKETLFRSLPAIFSRTQSYRSWIAVDSVTSSEEPVHVSEEPVAELKLASPAEMTSEQTQDARKGEEYVPVIEAEPLQNKPAKLICFYLPQFHPIPENNLWWGEGFTEWVNVQPAQPQFDGHYQPHVPDDLGYYNLLDVNVQRRQIELAKLYGIDGFCFYTYWFAGKSLLEKPVENYLSDSSLDLPFCLCWANENWSRRWDGLDSEILIAQQHSVEDDLAFIQHVSKYMTDPRYIRISGKPLLLVYRPSLLPCAKETAERWRNWCRENGVGEIYLAYTQSFEAVDPADYDFDAAIEFPPNNTSPPDITSTVDPVAEDFNCTVYEWRVFAERSKNYSQSEYKKFRGVCPSWDNTPRRKNNSAVFLNSSPDLYRCWLENAIKDTVQHQIYPDERLIFINAWNEWAEGAYLEPDDKYGYAYLQATRDALDACSHITRKHSKVVLVAHDAYLHGAQYLALNLAKTLSQGMGFDVDLVCLGGGPLKTEYARWANVHDLTGMDARGPEAVCLARRLYDSGNRVALVNTTVSGYFLETLTSAGFNCVALIHELRSVLDQFDLHGQAAAIAAHANKIVFPAVEVSAAFNDVARIDTDKIEIRPQGLYKRMGSAADHTQMRTTLRNMLELPQDSYIILGVGYADYRKGIDLFVEAGLKMAEYQPSAYWVWIGHWEQEMQSRVEEMLSSFPELRSKIVFPGLQSDTDVFYGGADLYAMTSREDPFPSVVLEAMDAALPVVGFDGAGGCSEILKEGCGRLVDMEDTQAYADAISLLLDQPLVRESMGEYGVRLINERFSFRRYVFDLLDFLETDIDRVSVIVPNYNYAHYLPERLLSIFRQGYPVYEIIFLDDRSTDDSVDIATKLLDESGIDYRMVVNEENSGSVFRQWKKGVELSTGSRIWIAEADDSCEDGFLVEVVSGFRDGGVVLSYCESQQMSSNGEIMSPNYWEYVSDVDNDRWRKPYVNEGVEEIRTSLSIKNTIPNVSAVLFDRTTLEQVLNENIDLICSYRIAGDWLVYILILEHGKISFVPTSLNKHRRHDQSVTIGSFNKLQLGEIQRMQDFVADRHSVPAEKEGVAKQYIETLSVQFGIS